MKTVDGSTGHGGEVGQSDTNARVTTDRLKQD